ncbi:hypothetical protein A0H81_12787 [Grifola frondosa]|uniref:Uncharacterized protein n=1 Tax=Grifola frondosa TaxID=5627 RepID=A0A1C7LSI6_GRIFR|nr:hypothetical protein A0H81_12787 [Grifola frondosa]
MGWFRASSFKDQILVTHRRCTPAIMSSSKRHTVMLLEYIIKQATAPFMSTPEQGSGPRRAKESRKSETNGRMHTSLIWENQGGDRNGEGCEIRRDW